MSEQPLRILAMDGGGSLSLLTLYMLERIQQERPDFLGNIDFFSGTSSGGINSLLIAGSEPRHIGLHQAIYLWSKVKVFSGSTLNTVRALGGCTAFFNNSTLAGYLRPILGNRTLGDFKPNLVIPAFDVNGEIFGQQTWKPKVFNNFGGSEEKDNELEAVEVALRTSAAPVFFPIYNRFADGGLAANNPAMCALAQALAPAPKGAGKTAQEVQLLSVGTGWDKSFLPVENANWGYQQWLLNLCQPLALIEAFFQGTTMVATFQADTLLGKQFFRLNPRIDKEFNINTMYQDVDDPGFKETVQKLRSVVEKPSADLHLLKADVKLRGEGAGSEDLWLPAVLTWLDEMGWTRPRRHSGTAAAAPAQAPPPASPTDRPAKKAAAGRRRAKPSPTSGGGD